MSASAFSIPQILPSRATTSFEKDAFVRYFIRNNIRIGIEWIRIGAKGIEKMITAPEPASPISEPVIAGIVIGVVIRHKFAA